MGKMWCGECEAELELDLDRKELICPNCGCHFDADDDEIQNWDGEYTSDECLSAYDAALIWLARGKDEDYTFGYTEEELENAL